MIRTPRGIPKSSFGSAGARLSRDVENLASRGKYGWKV